MKSKFDLFNGLFGPKNQVIQSRELHFKSFVKIVLMYSYISAGMVGYLFHGEFEFGS